MGSMGGGFYVSQSSEKWAGVGLAQGVSLNSGPWKISLAQVVKVVDWLPGTLPESQSLHYYLNSPAVAAIPLSWLPNHS